MAKITVSRLLETSRFLATKAGQELTDFITYVAEVSEQTIRALRANLTFEDNFRCFIKVANITTNVAFNINIDKKAPTGVFITQISNGAYGYSAFSWQINTQGLLTVTVTLVGGTSADVKFIVLL